jgi:hypothetical protein
MTTPNRPEAAAGWSEDELRSRIESLGEWFQNLDLGGV